MRNGKLKTRAIGFRVTEEVWAEAELRAVLAGKTVHEWCRDEVAERLEEGHGLSPGERLMYAEIVSLRTLLVDAFKLLAARQLDTESFAQVLDLNDEERAEVARDYFAELTQIGQLTGGEEGE